MTIIAEICRNPFLKKETRKGLVFCFGKVVGERMEENKKCEAERFPFSRPSKKEDMGFSFCQE